MNQTIAADEGTTEHVMIEAGFHLLSAQELISKIVDKTVAGDYLRGFSYIASFRPNGTMEGTNNAGSHNLGEWSVNPKDSTFTVKWNNGWDHTTTRAYGVDGKIKFYDSETGLWRTTFKELRK